MAQHYRNYSTEEAARLAGLTYRQVDHALRCGYLTIDGNAHGSGSRRAFTERDVLRIRAAHRLMESLKVDFPTALDLLPPDGDFEGEIRVEITLDLRLAKAEREALAAA